MDDVIGSVIDLALHLDRLLLVLGHFDTQDSKIWPTKIQSYEVPLFCQIKNADISDLWTGFSGFIFNTLLNIIFCYSLDSLRIFCPSVSYYFHGG